MLKGRNLTTTAFTFIKNHLPAFITVLKFDTAEPRDDHGRWTAAGNAPPREDKEAYKKWLRLLIRENYNHGMSRMESVRKKLGEQYPPGSGYAIHEESYLCDNLGRRLRDPKTGEARRIDFIVEKDGKVVRSIEVTSSKAEKVVQMGKENRIRDSHRETGKALYAQIKGGDVVRLPYSIKTRVWRTEDYAA
jgi:hypothetical protein